MIERFKKEDLSCLDELYEKLKSTRNEMLAPIAPVHLQKVGLFIARFQRVEFSIKELISFFYNQQTLDIILDEISFFSLLNILRKINTETISGQVNEDLSFLINQADILKDIRNIIVHSTYISSSGVSLNLMKGSKKKEVEKEFYEIEASEFDDLILIAEKLMNSFSAIALNVLKTYVA